MTAAALPPRWRRVTAELACSPARAWELLTDPEDWPRWGPTVRSASVGGPFVDGTPGTVVTSVGVPLPFVLRDVVPGRGWSWDVLGVRATSHHVVTVQGDPDRCVVSFGVPPWSLPYLAVCRLGLARLDRLVGDG